MSLKLETEQAVQEIFGESWDQKDGTVVPSDDSVTLGNDGINIVATVLYADLADSTDLVDGHTNTFAAEIYKAYLLVAGRIVRAHGGTITAYDGDRIMAVFIGDGKNSAATKAALKLNASLSQIIMPKLRAQYPGTNYVIRHVIGIDTSRLLVAKTGVRGANDLVWVGRAANYAAKLSSIGSEGYAIYLTDSVYRSLHKSSKFASTGEDMWEARTWIWNQMTVYRSNYLWYLD